MEPFITLYNRIVEEFTQKNSLVRIHGNNTRIIWPNGSGVYAIWNKDTTNIKNLIYVGLSGKFKRNREKGSISLNNSSFRNRKSRWTPYRFFESRKDLKENLYTFRYGPRYSSVNQQDEVKYEANAYSNSVNYDDLVIDCFIINENDEKYTSTYLESKLLTKYLKETNDLPPANNEL